ncbi:MAG: ABC transporter permease subunit, partial [Alphaproteobacteria bacterium]
LSFFGTSKRGYVYKFQCRISGDQAVQVFVSNPAIAKADAVEAGTSKVASVASLEEAAVTLGANGFQTFWRITLPNIKWALLTGIILCNARAMGEFGAVSVVSGHVRGQTNTIPLQVEILYNEYQYTAAFAMASLLTFLGLITLCIKTLLEWKTARQLKEGQT